MKPVYERLDEIATQALAYLYENDLLDDFLEDKYIDLNQDEREYFDIPEEPDDDWFDEDEDFEEDEEDDEEEEDW